MSNPEQVIIAGGGPVGMTLALQLAHHGIHVVLLERKPNTTSHPQANYINARAMEQYRRLGLADQLRAVGVSPHEPSDIVWATSTSGHVLHRFRYPSPAARVEFGRAANDGVGTLEASLRVSQVMIEPVLKAALDAHPLVDVRFGWSFERFEQDANGVTVEARNAQSGVVDVVQGAFVAGCDGGNSMVRQQAGIEFEGDFNVANVFMVQFESLAHPVLAKFGVAYHLQTGLGTMIAQNARSVWALHSVNPPTTDPDALLRRFAGSDFEYRVLVTNPWSPHLLVAQRYRNGRAFLVGDAAHQFIPTGGYGLNTGVSDAVDLGWKLAASIQGWGGEALLASYESERRQIAIQNCEASRRHMGVRAQIGAAIREAESLGDLDAPEASERRLALGKHIEALGNKENESWGIEYGYTYAHSQVICPEFSRLPFDPLRCPPVAEAGRRLLNLYLSDTTPLYDLLGPEFTLVVIGDADVTDLEDVAARIGFPLKILRLPRWETVLEKLGKAMLLVRPDQHVAWRGGEAPEDWMTILDVVAGRSQPEKLAVISES